MTAPDVSPGAPALYFGSGHSLGTLRMEDLFTPENDTVISLAFVGVAWLTVKALEGTSARATPRPAEVAEPAAPAKAPTAPEAGPSRHGDG